MNPLFLTCAPHPFPANPLSVSALTLYIQLYLENLRSTALSIGAWETSFPGDFIGSSKDFSPVNSIITKIILDVVYDLLLDPKSNALDVQTLINGHVLRLWKAFLGIDSDRARTLLIKPRSDMKPLEAIEARFYNEMLNTITSLQKLCFIMKCSIRTVSILRLINFCTIFYT